MQAIRNTKILVVEDDPEYREFLNVQLRRLGHGVLEAESGEEAVEKALTEIPDLIIMDLWLPGMDGMETTRRIKENPQTAHIPVLAYTGSEHKACRPIVMKAGMVEFLEKPTRSRVLRALLKDLLAHRPSQ